MGFRDKVLRVSRDKVDSILVSVDRLVDENQDTENCNRNMKNRINRGELAISTTRTDAKRNCRNNAA